MVDRAQRVRCFEFLRILEARKYFGYSCPVLFTLGSILDGAGQMVEW